MRRFSRSRSRSRKEWGPPSFSSSSSDESSSSRDKSSPSSDESSSSSCSGSSDEKSTLLAASDDSVTSNASSERSCNSANSTGEPYDTHFARRKDNKKFGIDVGRRMLLTKEDVLFFGLSYVGFGEERQHVREALNVNRFKAHFGPEPTTVADILIDLKEDFSSDLIYRDVFMSMNWLKLYDVEHVLAGRWKCGEDYIRHAVRENARKIQTLKPQVILLAGFKDAEIYVGMVDTCMFDNQEYRLNPHTKWYNHKSNSAGVKYEFALALRRDELLWMHGPIPAGLKHDRTIFCGGTQKEPKTNWDMQSLYFQLPEGKKLIGDSAYSGIPEKVTVAMDGHSKKARDFINGAKARQESYFWRLKTYAVLRGRFRHGKTTDDKLDKHQMCTEAVCVMVQYDLKHHPLMQVTGKVKVE